MVLEFASRLLSARDERERDHLIGATITHAADRAGGVLTPAAGSALGGLLKSVARRRLNGPTPGQALGLDLEGLEAHEQEFEATARIRPARRRGGAPCGGGTADRTAASRRASRVASAADLYAPPLVRCSRRRPPDPSR